MITPGEIDEQLLLMSKPRAFDIYILPGFLCWYAYNSKGMKRMARRVLFSSGVYMAMRNYASYKQAASAIAAYTLNKATEGTSDA